MADSGRLPQKYYFIKKVYIICHDKMEGLIIQGNLGTHLALKCDLVKLTLRSRHAHTHWKVESTLGQLMSRSICAALMTHSDSKSVLKIN